LEICVGDRGDDKTNQTGCHISETGNWRKAKKQIGGDFDGEAYEDGEQQSIDRDYGACLYRELILDDPTGVMKHRQELGDQANYNQSNNANG